VPSDFHNWKRIGIAGWLAGIYDPRRLDFQPLGKFGSG
jgi:hypothetical protein